MNTVAIFISPHLDDGVFSCGGYIQQLTAQGIKVVIATLFTADYSGHLPLSELAKYALRVWGVGERPFAIRREEDWGAAKIIGATPVHLGLLDCVFRQDGNGDYLYTKRVRDIPVHTSDWRNLEPVLQQTLRELFEQYSACNVRIFCPLAIGGHVDHIIVRRAVENLIDPAELYYYEDLPYALHSEINNNQICSTSPCIIALSDHDMKARLDASACYVSQIPSLFPSRWEMLHEIMDARLPLSRRICPIHFNIPNSIRRMNTRLRVYSKKVGGERYWTKCTELLLIESYER
jgi:LmbE family N-acetylglucosaminyl deacetylase